MNLSFYTLDVFTAQPFAGNPLAVVFGGEGLDTERMQAIAAEFNLSETVFVLRAVSPGALACLRIFTPRLELPFAGHPTVGTAVLLAELGMTPAGDEVPVVLDENVGPVPVVIRKRPGEPIFAQLTAATAPSFEPATPPAEALAEVLGLAVGDIGGAPRYASVGLPYLLLPLRTREALSRARPRTERWSSAFDGAWAQQVYLYHGDPASGELLHARMFAPALGVGEDPATGSAAVALCAALADAESADGRYAWTIEQGRDMGRPGQLYIEAERSEGRIAAVRVGGFAVSVSQGRLLSY